MTHDSWLKVVRTCSRLTHLNPQPHLNPPPPPDPAHLLSQRFVPPINKIHMDRVSMMARSVRLGYNVLLVDTDIVLLHDPYR